MIRRISIEQLDEILKNHQHFLNEDCDNWECMRADLSYVDLSWVNLSRVNLSRAYLSYANLNHTNLSYANLSYADLSFVNLSHADLSFVNLTSSILRNADLSFAILKYSDLSCIVLTNTNLNHANLRYSNLYCTCLTEVRNIPYMPMACPEEGSFIGYKKTKDNLIVQLEIPSDAKRSSAIGRKCRCDKARVLAIYNLKHNLLDTKEARSEHNPSFIYKVGEIVEEPNFCDDRWRECAEGIHFFMNFQEAVNYHL